jgi:hypothetical protein
MRLRHAVAALFVLFALAFSVTPALAAGSISFPAAQTYGDQATLTIAGLQPNTTYTLSILDPGGRPVFSEPFTTGATGGYRFPDFGPDETDLPGAVIFQVSMTGGQVIATSTTTLTGVSPYFRVRRLGA